MEKELLRALGALVILSLLAWKALDLADTDGILVLFPFQWGHMLLGVHYVVRILDH